MTVGKSCCSSTPQETGHRKGPTFYWPVHRIQYLPKSLVHHKDVLFFYIESETGLYGVLVEERF